jgi:SNF2 family DNA or RNA helicase
VITSYDLLKKDVEHYAGRLFHYFAIDEAQYIKNQNTKCAQAVKQIECRQRFALTGTPIENRLSELWSIFDFLMPGYLYGYARFRQKFELPVVKNEDEGAREQLRRLISPFIMRRLKAEVLSELPPKVSTVVPVRLEGEQRNIYDATLSLGLRQLRSETADAKTGEAKLRIFALLTRLRQLCCDPSLCCEGYRGPSAKLEACLELLSEAKSSGQRVLLFSQFASMLDIIRKRLNEEGISSMLLRGSTPKEKRLDMAERFNAGEADAFLISLKAGGTGLNLTGANVVIHYDPWWNMAAQEQATDRAHRIGQTRSVQVCKLIAAGTIEERILSLQERKGGLASIIEGGGEQSLLNMSVGT